MTIVGAEALERIKDRARTRYPNEVCGLLASCETSEDPHICLSFPMVNRTEIRGRFLIDKAELIRAEAYLRFLGFRIVGVYHSHPDAPPEPSGSDKAAVYPHWLYLIASVRKDSAYQYVKLYRANADRVLEPLEFVQE